MAFMVLGQIKKRFGLEKPEVKALSEEELQDGFQEIYAVETVDLQTVKPIESGPEEPEVPEEELRFEEAAPAQLELPLFGSGFFPGSKIDFEAWVKSLIPEEERKKCWLVLEEYGLKKMLALSATETVEIKRLSDERRRQWREEGRALFSSERFLHLWKEAGKTFLLPWIFGRFGIAKEYELEERLEQLALNREVMEQALPFFRDLLLQGMDFFGACFPQVERGVYAANGKVANRYRQLMEAAESYFYRKGVRYPFEQLLSLLSRELAKKWEGLPDGFIEKALHFSPAFIVLRGKGNSLTIQRRTPFFG